MSEEQPVKEGFLHKAHPRESFLSVTLWQKRYFVLWSKGTLEYYTNYTKKAEEYCGTLNLLECQDMVAPMIVGKRHNIIKLSVFKNDKLKDYWLDCDCPPVLNDWVKSLAEASELCADDGRSKNNKLTNNSSNVQRRPLPTAPPSDSGIEQESDEEVLEGDTYEEIDDTPTSPISEGNSLRRFTRSMSDHEKRNSSHLHHPPIPPKPSTNTPNNTLLKRGAIKEPAPSPISLRKPHPLPGKPHPPPAPVKPHQLGKPRSDTSPSGMVDFDELQRTLQRRASSISPDELNYEGPTEAYEPVQFTADVIVGSPRLPPPKANEFQESRHEGPAGYTPYTEREQEFSSSCNYSPCSTPSVPPRDIKPAGGVFFNSEPPPLPPRDTSPLMISKVSHTNANTSSSVDSPPLPPPRDVSNRSPLPSETVDTPPPPIPRRIPGQSDRSEPAHRRIIPYRTTEIIEEPPNHTPSNQTPNNHTPSNHTDDNFTTVRHAPPFGGKPFPLKQPPITTKPRPPAVKPKPKPQVPAKPVLRDFPDAISRSNGSDSISNHTRAPAVLPKPKPKSHSISENTRIHHKAVTGSNSSGLVSEKGRGKRPPMPPPKPK